jgi:anti-sigma regulatory factor (Ser/Thr protein kinase)
VCYTASVAGGRIHLARRPQAAAEAREALKDLDGGLSAPLLADLRLLVTEIVANRVAAKARGAATWLELEMDVSDRSVRVQLTDVGRHWVFEPSPHSFDPEDSSGWSLYLVDRLADRWGVTRDDPAIRIWFELELD